MKRKKINSKILILISIHFIFISNYLYAQDPFIRLEKLSDMLDASQGVGWADYNNDGYPDMYVSNGAQGFKQHNLLFMNNGDGIFTQITSGEIVTYEVISGGCSWGDFDNDGDLDIYITTNRDNFFDPIYNYLFENNGDGTFTKNTTAGPPVDDGETSVSCGWGDYNNDSHIDLFVTNGWMGNEKNSLYSNSGDSTFTKITNIDLVSDDNATPIAGFGWADYDNDGDLDVYVAGGNSPNNFLWRNNGNGDFTKLDIFGAGQCEACSWGDYDNDDDLDIFITNYGDSQTEPEPNWLYRNDGNDVFTKITLGEIATDSSFSRGSAWGDIDNDGDLDLFVSNDGPPNEYKNFLYLNDGNGNLTKITSVVNDSTYAYGAAFADYNKDGFLDLFVCRSGCNYLFKNNELENGNTNHWINIQCVGTVSNWAGIGAKVRVRANINSQNVWQMREISAQTGYGSHNNLRAHFGLGDATIIAELKVEWPSGIVQTLTNVAVDQFLTITEQESGENIAVTSPNGGENWEVGSVHDITWTSNETSGNLDIAFSTDGGSSWTTIVTNEPDDGNYPWTIPDQPSTNCLVRITDTDGDPSDVSDAVFTISQVSYTLTMAVDPPEGGTTEPAIGNHSYTEGTVVNIIATPNQGYGFVNWTGDVADPNAATTTVTMNGDQTVTANFALIPGQITDLRASVQDTHILLEWSPSAAATSYHVYRDTTYDFVADQVNATNQIAESITDEDPVTDGVQWTDTGNGAKIIGDVNINYFYRVTAFSGVESDTSNLAGEFDYPLITTSSTDINELVVIMNTQNTRKPIFTAEDLANAIPYCSDVYYWDAKGQGTVGHPKGVPFNNFSIYPGYPYIVNVTSDTVWTVAGSYSDTSFQLSTTDGTDINHIGVPLSKDILTTAEELGNDIPNCTDVYYWDAEGQGTVGHVVGLPFENFAVRAGYPYYVNVTADAVWPSAVGDIVLSSSVMMTNGLSQQMKKGLVAGGVPHTVYGTLSCWDKHNFEANDLKVKAWVIGRSDEVITDASVTTGCDGHYWWIGVSNFATAWQVGDSLQVEITDATGRLQANTIVVLTEAGPDHGGKVHFSVVTGVDELKSQTMPQEFILYQNYPNPFNPETIISFQLPEARNVILKVYNLHGAEICTLLNEKKEGGQHQVTWHGKDNLGQELPSGVYFIRIVAGDYRMIRKMIKIR